MLRDPGPALLDIGLATEMQLARSASMYTQPAGQAAVLDEQLDLHARGSDLDLTRSCPARYGLLALQVLAE